MIDTHLHLWRLATGWYGWNTPELGALHADSALEDVDLGGAGVGSVIAVQAADTVEETRWLLGLADRDPAVAGVVGYLPLDDPRTLSTMIERAGPALVGVRQLWHDHDRLDGLNRPETLSCLQILGGAGLAVDVPDAFPGLWPALTAAVAGAPETIFVLDHVGKPPFGQPTAWRRWEAALVELLAHPNVVVKLSGLFGGSGSTIPATAAELARVVQLVREHAGADRTMIGSDWPMVRGRLTYVETIERTHVLLTGWSAAEREAAATDTARRVYRLR